MRNYSEDFGRFTQGIGQQLSEGQGEISQALSNLGRIRASQRSAAMKQKADMRNAIASDIGGFDGSDMYDWQAASTRKQIAQTGQLWMNGEIDALEYASMITSIDTNINKAKANYRAEVGNPETSKATDSTYWGQMKAIDAMVTQGVNVHEDNHVVIKGLNGTDEDLFNTQQTLSDRFDVRNGGKAPNAQILDSYYSKQSGTYEWTYVVGDPTNPQAATTMSAKDFLENHEGKGAFLLEFDNLTRIMSDYAVEDRVENSIQDGDTREMEQWFNSELMRNKAFRKDVFSQFGGSLFDKSEAATMDKIFSSMEGLSMSYDAENNDVSFDEQDPNSYLFSRMVSNARDNFVREYKVRHQDKTGGEGSTPRSEMIRYDQVIPIEFNTMDAYDDVAKELTVSGVKSQGLSYSGIKPESFQNLKPLTGLESPMKMGGGEDMLVGATRANGEEFKELDGELIGKFVRYEDITVPSVSPEEAEKYKAAGIPVPTEEKSEPVYYYRQLTPSQKEAYYKEIGQKLNYPPGERQKAGEEYIYNKYVLGQ